MLFVYSRISFQQLRHQSVTGNVRLNSQISSAAIRRFDSVAEHGRLRTGGTNSVEVEGCGVIPVGYDERYRRALYSVRQVVPCIRGQAVGVVLDAVLPVRYGLECQDRTIHVRTSKGGDSQYRVNVRGHGAGYVLITIVMTVRVRICGAFGLSVEGVASRRCEGGSLFPVRRDRVRRRHSHRYRAAGRRRRRERESLTTVRSWHSMQKRKRGFR